MRGHTANELTDRVDIIAADGSTVLASSVNAGISDLTGQRREQAQLIAAETTHVVIMRANDATVLTESCYLRSSGLLYIVDYKIDPRRPRPGMWIEVYCHLERTVS